ncbi:hypothetical protein NC652_022345 [Populus alba x Populus x berolinensis]|nr:hypothetical protein NC652_022345 [Populus alba x Populus x berolinensis]
MVDPLDSRTYVSSVFRLWVLFSLRDFREATLGKMIVDKGWKVKKGHFIQKFIRMDELPNACIMPNQHYLVYASLSPVVHIVMGAESDVNTVCFADETGHLLYSGSDDNLCKVKAIHLTLKI